MAKSSLVAKWLGFWAFIAMTWVQSWSGKIPQSHTTWPKKLKTNTDTHNGQHTDKFSGRNRAQKSTHTHVEIECMTEMAFQICVEKTNYSGNGVEKTR